MEILYKDMWEFNDLDSSTWTDFITGYKLVDVFYNKFKDQLAEYTENVVTKDNIFARLEDAFYHGFYNPYDLLEGLAQQFIKENDLFDQVFFIEDIDSLYRVTFYEVIPTNQTDVKRFFEKHLDAYKNGFGEVVEEVIKKRSRNTPT